MAILILGVCLYVPVTEIKPKITIVYWMWSRHIRYPVVTAEGLHFMKHFVLVTACLLVTSFSFVYEKGDILQVWLSKSD
jgi:hypothetical protein